MVTAKKRAGTQIFYWRFKMTEEQKEMPKVSDMLRLTSKNTTEFMLQIADHIDKLEDQVVQLSYRITQLEDKK
jgi:hypothetical protein